jgi:hypothetical protein
MRLSIVIFGILLLFVVSCGSEVVDEPAIITLEEMQVCETAAECVYADNSCCPHTDYDNIVAINVEYVDVYDLLGPDCGEQYACVAMYVAHEYGPDCVANQCVVVTFDDYVEAQEREELEEIMGGLEAMKREMNQ